MDIEIAVKYLGTERGRGVVARRSFKKGDVVEHCPVLFVFDGFAALKDKDNLSQYEFAWGHKKVAMVGGLAHFYNHADKPNVAFERDLLNGVLIVTAACGVKPGDELCHKYACKPWWTK